MIINNLQYMETTNQAIVGARAIAIAGSGGFAFGSHGAATFTNTNTAAISVGRFNLAASQSGSASFAR